LEDALSTLAACRSETAGGAAWRDVTLRRYMVSAAVVRQLPE
jgi:hypothetical protein